VIQTPCKPLTVRAKGAGIARNCFSDTQWTAARSCTAAARYSIYVDFVCSRSEWLQGAQIDRCCTLHECPLYDDEIPKWAAFCHPVSLAGATPAGKKIPLTLPPEHFFRVEKYLTFAFAPTSQSARIMRLHLPCARHDLPELCVSFPSRSYSGTSAQDCLNPRSSKEMRIISFA
jgi:hypothetical protein